MKKIPAYILGLLLITSCMQKQESAEDFPLLTGDYLGQELPGDSAVLFAPGIVSTGISTRDVAVSPDGNELYFGVSVGGFTYTTILVCRRVDGKWTAPEIAPFCPDPKVLYLEPAMSWDGNKLFFLSTMADWDESPGDQDIWFVNRTGTGWSEPLNLGGPVNTEHSEFYPSLTKEGHLYFTRAQTGSQLNRIYRSRLLDGEYQEPELLPEQVNCGSNRFNAFISPDEDYIIVPALGMEDSYGGVDYYIVFRNEMDQWSEPINMGPKINSAAIREWSSWVSRDGRVLFFMSNRIDEIDPGRWNYEKLKTLHNAAVNGNSSIYWISADIIDELRDSARFSPGTETH